MALGVFAVIGCIAGQIAGRIVEDAVRGRLTAEMARRATEKSAAQAR